jgi:hypothetical protein
MASASFHVTTSSNHRIIITTTWKPSLNNHLRHNIHPKFHENPYKYNCAETDITDEGWLA